MTDNNDIDNPHVANLKNPSGTVVLTINGRDMTIDKVQLAAAADRLGADRYDVLSIGGYCNSRGEWEPDYGSVRIERRNLPGKNDDE